MPDHHIAVTSVDTERPPDEVWTLLGEFHEWLRDTVDEALDPTEGLEADEQSLASEPETWAWVARRGGDPAGCVLLHGLTGDLAEFRRLWVRPRHRGHGIGRRLTRLVIEKAGAEGYETLGLTTPPQGKAAHALYESLGFERTLPYPETRLDEAHHDEAIFMQLDLSDLPEGLVTGMEGEEVDSQNRAD